MKVKNLAFSLMLFCHLFFSLMLAASERDIRLKLTVPAATDLQIISTTRGDKLIGTIMQVKSDTVFFLTEFGLLKLPIPIVEEIDLIKKDSFIKGQYWFSNPNATRLYFAPTGRQLKQGDGYFSDYYIFFPGFAYGITDKITIGGGMSIFPGLGIDEQMFYLTPKIGIKSAESFNISAGALLIRIPEMDDEGGDDDSGKNPLVGIFYSVATFGSTNSNFTAGFGLGFVEHEFSNKPMIMLGGEHRLSRRLAFVTENWIIPGAEHPLISYGVRFFNEKLSVDLALVNILNRDAIFPGIPYLDFVFNF
jgi:hypothetical protein